MKPEHSWNFFERYNNIKFNENQSSRSRVVPCGKTDRKTDIMKLTVALRSFANARKNWHKCTQESSSYNTHLERNTEMTYVYFHYILVEIIMIANNTQITWHCRDRVSSCKTYAVQQDAQSVLMIEFIHHVC